MSSAFAPGKVILFGEHAVVYGRPALAIPLPQIGVTVSIEIVQSSQSSPEQEISLTNNWKERVSIEAPAIGRAGSLASFSKLQKPDPLALTIEKTLEVLNGTLPYFLNISITSTIPVASGFGSGAAVTVALVRALTSSLGKSISDEKVNQIAFEIEKLYHGTPSGIDNTVITYANPVYFKKNSPIQIFQVQSPFTLVIADSGVEAATHESVGDVRALWLVDPKRYEAIFTEIGSLVDQARDAIQNGDIESLGAFMNQNHILLREISVSSPLLDRLVLTACTNGALGAKLSGGGRGGNIIALAEPKKAEFIKSSLYSAGAKSVMITTVE